MGKLKELYQKSLERNIEQDRIKKGLKDGTLARYGSSTWLEREFEKSGLDSSYKDAWMSNPYWAAYNRYSDSDGMFSDIQRGLFGSTSADRNAIQAEQDAMNYQASLINEFRQNQYNSDESKVGRMNAAGLNSNLLGTDHANQDVGSQFQPDPTNYESTDADMQALSSLNPFINMASNIFGIARDFLALKNMKSDLYTKELGRSMNLKDLAWAAADSSITPQLFESLAKISEDDKKTMLAGDSDMDEFLDASIKTSTAADNWLNSMFGDLDSLKPYQRKMYNQARQYFVARRNSMALGSKSWQEFAAMRQSQSRPEVINQDFFNGVVNAALRYDDAQYRYKTSLAVIENSIISDADIQMLMKDERFQSLRKQAEEASLAADVANAQDAAFLDPDTGSNVSEAFKQSFITLIKETAAKQAAAELAATTYNIRLQYFEDYDNMSAMGWDAKYSKDAPAGVRFKSAVRGDPYSDSKLDLSILRYLVPFAK